MPIDERKIYFEKYIEDLKEADKKAAQLKLNQAAFGDAFNNNTLQSNSRGQWYFYNNHVELVSYVDLKSFSNNYPIFYCIL